MVDRYRMKAELTELAEIYRGFRNSLATSDFLAQSLFIQVFTENLPSDSL